MHNDCNAGHFNEFRSDVSFGALVSVPIAQRQENIEILTSKTDLKTLPDVSDFSSQ